MSEAPSAFGGSELKKTSAGGGRPTSLVHVVGRPSAAGEFRRGHSPGPQYPQQELRSTSPARRPLQRAARQVVRQVFRRLAKVYGIPRWKSAGRATDELILTILSQHTNDRNRDTAYRRLKKTFANWAAVERAGHAHLAEAIRATGLANQKAQAIQGALRQIRQDRGNYSLEFLKKMEMEEARQYLCSIPGVGPKTSACVLLFCFGKPVFPVDTHIHRVTTRLGLVPKKIDAAKAHESLAPLIPPEWVYPMHLMLIWHGRDTCHAQRPECKRCTLLSLCPYGKKVLGLPLRGAVR